MARSTAKLADWAGLRDVMSWGVLEKVVPLVKVKAALERTGKESKRQREMPAHVTMYYVIALALYMQVSQREVLRCLLEGLQWLLGTETAAEDNREKRDFSGAEQAGMGARQASPRRGRAADSSQGDTWGVV